MSASSTPETEIESGLLTVFRLSLLIRLGLLFFILDDFFKTLFPNGRAGFFVALYLGEVAFLLVYLSWPGLFRRLGRAYLPLALGTNTVLPAFEAYLLMSVPVLETEMSVSYLLMSIWLLPLFLTAWQYPLRAVWLFCLVTLGLPLALEWAGGLPLQWDSYLHEMVSRTMLFGLLGYLMVRLVNIQRAQRRALQQANQKLVAHAATLEQLTVSRERNRLAREMHDTLAHTLSSTAVQLDAALARWPDMPPEASTRLEQCLTTVRAGLEETRRALQALRATPLADLGLVLALRSLAEDWASRKSFVITMDLPESVEGLPAEIEHAYYRIAQEALENIFRHANARQVVMRLSQSAGWLTLTITDDGEGFTSAPETYDRHFGIKGIRERAEMIGAQFTLTSQPGHGTQVCLLWRCQV